MVTTGIAHKDSHYSSLLLWFSFGKRFYTPLGIWHNHDPSKIDNGL